MILKTNLRRWIFALCFELLFLANAQAGEVECLRDLIPITDNVSYRMRRAGVERPFVVSGKFVVFPEVQGAQLTGFYIYTDKSKKYYDAVMGKKSVADLAAGFVYDLVAQPDGLETVTVSYTPQMSQQSSRTPSSAAVGSSMLPVVGVLVEFQENRKAKAIYNDPSKLSQTAAFDRKLMQLSTKKSKSSADLLSPLRAELKIRKDWIQRANLDNESFKQLNKVLQTTCKSVL